MVQVRSSEALRTIDVNVGRWPRFSAYRLTGDGFIRPERSSRLTTYPLSKLLSETSELEGQRELVFALSQLSKLRPLLELNPRDHSSVERYLRSPEELRQDDELVETVLNFSAAFGLLGIFHHRFVYSETTLPHPLGGYEGWIVQPRPTDWLLRRSERSSESGQSFVIARRGVFRSELEMVPTAEFLERYLPDSGSGAWPAPDQEEFWWEYGEPFEEWVDAMRHVLDIVRDLTRPSSDSLAASSAKMGADHLLRHVHPIVRFDEKGARHLSYYIPTLLAALAMSAAHDPNIRQCAATKNGQRCPTVFSTAYTQSEYCGTRCSNREKVRRSRQRKKAEQAKKERRRVRRRSTRAPA